MGALRALPLYRGECSDLPRRGNDLPPKSPRPLASSLTDAARSDAGRRAQAPSTPDHDLETAEAEVEAEKLAARFGGTIAQ